MWSKLGSDHAQHRWTHRSKQKTGGDGGAFKAALCSSGLVGCPTKPCYPEKTILGAEKFPGERSTNRSFGKGEAGDISAP